METGDKKFIEMTTIREAALNAIAAHENSQLSAVDGRAGATFFGAVEWLIIQMCVAAQSDQLMPRLVEFIEEMDAIKAALDKARSSELH